MGAFLLGLTTPFWRRELERNLRRLGGAPLETVVYLTASHDLVLYYFFLLGPLLGKDVLLSHVLGAAFFVPFASLLWGALDGARRCAGPRSAAEPARAVPRASGGATDLPAASSLILGEGWRYLLLSAYGLAVGGLLAAYGLSGPSFMLSDLPLSPALNQVVGAGIGLLASVASFMWPVSNLFVGTYLWKLGLAHAGLVAFFYGSAVSPQRVRLYARVFGGGRSARLVGALALAALLAGVAVALLFGLTELSVRYKLVPEQMWRIGA